MTKHYNFKTTNAKKKNALLLLKMCMPSIKNSGMTEHLDIEKQSGFNGHLFEKTFVNQFSKNVRSVTGSLLPSADHSGLVTRALGE